MSADPASKVVSLYLPERAEAEEIAVREAGVRGKPVTTGSILREFIRAGIAAYWKKNGQPNVEAPPKASKRKRARPK